jgi:hypothetical protein
LAERLNSPFLDKDDILEALFDGLSCSDAKTRQQLSRAADRVFVTVARNCSRAVLCSFWRHPSSTAQSGTPSNWLQVPEIRMVEVSCGCSPELAAARFLGRVRHSGHSDARWNQPSLVAQSEERSHTFPLDAGAAIDVNTTNAVDIGWLAERVRKALEV